MLIVQLLYYIFYLNESFYEKQVNYYRSVNVLSYLIQYNLLYLILMFLNAFIQILKIFSKLFLTTKN